MQACACAQACACVHVLASTGMYVCRCVHMCMCACICVYRCICAGVCIHVQVCAGMCMCVHMCIRAQAWSGVCVQACACMYMCVQACAGVCMLVPRDPSATVGLGRTCGVSPALWTGRAPCGRQPPPARPPLPVLLTPSLFPHFLLSSAVHCESSPKSLDMVLLSGAGLQIFSRSPRIVLSSTQSRKGRGVRLILRVCC